MPSFASSPGTKDGRTVLPVPLDARRRLLGRIALALIALGFVAWWRKGSLPAPESIQPALFEAPIQSPTEREPFDFEYEGHTIRVRPVAEYELWGVVVSHNDIRSIADIYHDGSAVDTKDLCVAWGENLRSGSLSRVEFESGPFTCYYRYPAGVRVRGSEISNNHLITDSAALRDALAGVRIGDQIHLQGVLVDYQLEDWRDFWRRSSRVRTDSWDGACEVVYFEKLEVLAAGTPLWYFTFRLALVLLVVVAALWVHSVRVDSLRLAGAAKRPVAFSGAPPDVWPGSPEA